MASIAHPTATGRIGVSIIDTESHHGESMAQIEATDPDTELEDSAGEQPWVFVDEIEFDEDNQ